MNKDDLVNILIDWIEEDKKVDGKREHFINIEDITSVCGGRWIDYSNKKHSNTWIKMKKNIKIRNSIIKNGWSASHSPCLLSFIKPQTKNKKGWASDIIVTDGNHRIAMLKINNLKTKIYTKFTFSDSSYFAKRYIHKPNTYNKNGELHYPYRKKIQYLERL